MNLPGPYATMMLRALGAEVVKVEPPRGDTARIFGRLFEILNAGKQGIVADLKQPYARAQVEALIGRADVVVEGFRPGVMERFDLGPEAMTRKFERLIYCSISGFGQQGPYRDRPGHDLNFQALTGVCHMLRDGDDKPLGGAIPFGDLSASMSAVTSILAALVQRGRTGQGQILDVAMVDALLSWAYVWSEGLTPSDASLSSAASPTRVALRDAAQSLPGPIAGVLDKLADGLGSAKLEEKLDAVTARLRRSKRVQKLERLRLHTLPHYTVYETSDGRHLSIGIVDEDKFWRAMCEVLELGAAAKVPLWGRFIAATPLRKMVAGKIIQAPLEVWTKRFEDAGVPVAPVLTVDEALDDPQLRVRRPADGPVRGPWCIGETVDAPAPALGEHTHDWLK